MDSFTQLGRRMAQDLGISAKDLETRINSLGTKFPQEQVRAIVTGFIDASLETKDWGTQEVYALLHGFGRWLYNGTFDGVRKRVLDKLAQRDPGRLTLECLSGDQEGLNYIAEALIEKDPDFARTHYKGEKRPEILRRIIEEHSDGKDTEREIAVSCMEELNDTECIRKLAHTYLKTDFKFAKRLLMEHGTKEDLLILAEKLKKEGEIKAASDLIEKNGTNEQIETFIREIRNKDIQTAYELSRRSGIPKELFNEIRQQMIQETPEVAANVFYAPWQKGESPRLNDREGMLAVARRYAQLKQYSNAINAFRVTLSGRDFNPDEEQIGEEISKAALEILRSGQDVKGLRDIFSRSVGRSLDIAIITYFKEGGSPIIVDKNLDTQVEAGLSIKLAHALAKLVDPGAYHACSAYSRIIRLEGRLDEKEKKFLAELRERILQQPYAGNFFSMHNDQEGMRAYIDRNVESNPESAYKIARNLDETTWIKARQALVKTAVEGKLKPRDVFRIFEDAKDQWGVAELQKALAPGVDENVAQTLLARPERRYH